MNAVNYYVNHITSRAKRFFHILALPGKKSNIRMYRRIETRNSVLECCSRDEIPISFNSLHNNMFGQRDK